MKQNGFTLIELMVVVVIIGILAAIALPNFLTMQDRAKESEVKSNTHTIQLAIEDYKTNTSINPTTSKPVNFISPPLAAGAGNAYIPAVLKNPFNTAKVGTFAVNTVNAAGPNAAIGANSASLGGQIEYYTGGGILNADGVSGGAPYQIYGVGRGSPNPSANTGKYVATISEGI